MKFPLAIESLISKGYVEGINRNSTLYNTEIYHRRPRARKWRNLCGEARFDIPDCLWQYMDWQMPAKWNETNEFYKIKSHDFVIQIPELLPLVVRYKETTHGGDMQFHVYEITTPSGDVVVGKKQEEFAFFVSLCYELKCPHRRPVRIEEIKYCDLPDGAVRHTLERPLELDYGYC